VPEVLCGAGRPKRPLERLPVIGRHPAQAPARRGPDGVRDNACSRPMLRAA
jgi:hypothetical protein